MKRAKFWGIKALFAILSILLFAWIPGTVFAAENSAVLNIPVSKQIRGNTPLTDSTFTFELKAVGSAPMPSGSENGIKTADIQGSGTVYFGNIIFTEPGNYQYEIRELEGKNTRYTYDSSVYHAAVQVSWEDAVNGKMQAIMVLTKDDGTEKQKNILFSNKYKKPSSPGGGGTDVPSAPAIDPPVEKVITGSPAQTDTFHFRLMAEDKDNPMPEGSADGIKRVSIAGAGSTDFGEIRFADTGIYTYFISEINDGLAGYTYDTTIYTMTVTVKDIGKRIQATYTILKNDGTTVSRLFFTNAVLAKPASSVPSSSGSGSSEASVPSVPSQPDTPKTGDESNDVLWWILLGISALGITVTLYLGKKKTRKK